MDQEGNIGFRGIGRLALAGGNGAHQADYDRDRNQLLFRHPRAPV